jgi:hypothetical protein
MTTRRRARSWVDVVTDWIDRLPGPPWVAYAALVVIPVAATVILRLLDGLSVHPLTIVYAALTFTPFAATFAINRAARRALADFRPALGELEPEYDELERRLSSASVVTGIVGAAVGIAFVTVGTLAVDGTWGVSPENSLATNAVILATQYILNASLITLLLHQVGNLRTIMRIHRDATNIQLWNVRPHNAFARVTVLAAAAIIVPYVTAAVLSALLSDNSENSVIAIAITVVAVAIATLLFVGPLVGMRRRLVREKERQLSETDRVFEAVAASFRTEADAGDLGGADTHESALAVLGAERDRLKRVSTWPWSAETLRAFVTSLAIPILLWLLTSLLGRLLFS